MAKKKTEVLLTDALLVGGGIMSATLGTMIKHLDPSKTITMVERLDHVAHESTEGWNNAGTGHAGYCELNYTPQKPDGTVDIKRALEINASFENSKEFWSYLVKQGKLPSPDQFIYSAPHKSFVWGEQDVAYLKARYEQLKPHHMFDSIEFTDDPKVVKQWMPLIMEGRDVNQKVAATQVVQGSDVDFGILTRNLVSELKKQPDFNLKLSHHVKHIKRTSDGQWCVTLHDAVQNATVQIKARFVFLGAGGGTLPLLQKSAIPESKGYGGFPVSGLWLVCRNPEVVKKHHAKVYGKAALGAPPMSVPHLDVRIIEGEKALLFGPFAGFTTKFLKEGSYFDLISSVKSDNCKPMLQAGITNLPLTRYLIKEALHSHEDRMKTLRKFYPDAKSDDWILQTAGNRVQIIKTSPTGKGKLEFGTEIVSAKDGSLAALLGASPGASTAVTAMTDIVERCLSDHFLRDGWQSKMKEMIPSYGESLIDDVALLRRIRGHTLHTLQLDTKGTKYEQVVSF